MSERDYLSYLLGILLPDGGYMASFASAFLDESGSHAGSPVLCVAGFLFEREQAELLGKEWRAMLAREKLPYIHMAEFADGRHGPYKHLSKPERERIERECVSIISRYRTLAFACGVNEKKFNEIVAGYPNLPVNAYTFLLGTCGRMIERWAKAAKFDGKVAYFFETGHEASKTYDFNMTSLSRQPSFRKMLRYGSHTFADHLEVVQLQCADMLAWLSAKYFSHYADDHTKMRADLKALVMWDRNPIEKNLALGKPMTAMRLWHEDAVRYIFKNADYQNVYFFSS